MDLFEFILNFFVDVIDFGRGNPGRFIFFVISFVIMVIGGIAVYKGNAKDGFVFIALGIILFVILLLIGKKKEEKNI